MGECRLSDVLRAGEAELDVLLHGHDHRIMMRILACSHAVHINAHDDAASCIKAVLESLADGMIDERLQSGLYHALASQQIAARRPRDARRTLLASLRLGHLSQQEGLLRSYRRLGVLLSVDMPIGLRNAPVGRKPRLPACKRIGVMQKNRTCSQTQNDALQGDAYLGTAPTALDAAVQALRVALSIDPQDAIAHHGLGLALVPRNGDFSRSPQLESAQEAAVHLSAAVVLRPSCEQWHLRAIAVVLRGRLASTSQLVAMSQAAVALHPLSAAGTQQLVSLLLWDRRPSEAQSVASRAVSLGLFPSVASRPVRFSVGLEARPMWPHERAAPGLCSALRSAHGAIAAELESLERTGRCVEQDEGLHLPNSTWRVCDVFGGCVAGAARVRATCAALRMLPTPGHIISAQFSLLGVGAVVRPHTGPTNSRLVLHFGVTVRDGGASIRVGRRWHRFKDGGCFAFDDSHEHEVVHWGDRRRDNLVVHVVHPGLLHSGA